MKKTLSVILSVIIMLTFAFTSLGASIAVQSIKSDPSNVTLKVGKTCTLKVTVTPTNATNKKVTYSSANKNIATVDKNGKMKGIKAGNTTITVMSSSNKKAVAKCKVTILQATTVLSMWSWKVAYVPGFQAVSDKLEKSLGIKVKIETFTPDATYRQKLIAAANAGNLPDIVHDWAGYSTVPTGVFDLQKDLDAGFRGTFFTSAWDPIVITADRVKGFAADKDATEVQKALKAGQFFGVPLDVGGFFTFYGNTKIITDAGLKAEAPKTWEEFIDMMKTIKDKTGKPGLVFGAKCADVWQNWAGCALEVMMNGEEGYKALLTRQDKLTDPKHLKAIQGLEAVAKAGAIMPGILALDIDAADQVFAQGKVAFDLGGSFTFSNFINMGMKPTDFIAFQVPPMAGSKYEKWSLNPFTLTMLSISKNTKSKTAALEYLKFISSKEGAVLFGNGAFTVPAVALGDAAKNLNPSLGAVTSSYVSSGDPLGNIKDVYPHCYWDNAEWRVFDTSMQKLVAGEFTAQQVAEAFENAKAKEMEKK